MAHEKQIGGLLAKPSQGINYATVCMLVISIYIYILIIELTDSIAADMMSVVFRVWLIVSGDLTSVTSHLYFR